MTSGIDLIEIQLPRISESRDKWPKMNGKIMSYIPIIGEMMSFGFFLR